MKPGSKHGPDYSQRQSEIMKRIGASPEARLRNSLAAKMRWARRAGRQDVQLGRLRRAWAAARDAERVAFLHALACSDAAGAGLQSGELQDAWNDASRQARTMFCVQCFVPPRPLSSSRKDRKPSRQPSHEAAMPTGAA